MTQVWGYVTTSLTGPLDKGALMCVADYALGTLPEDAEYGIAVPSNKPDNIVYVRIEYETTD